jgi:AraC-like DNA-binding protein
MRDTPPVTSVEFATSGFRPHEQYDAWRSWHNRTFDGSPAAPSKSGFLARSDAATMDGLALIRISMPAMRVMRTRALIRRNPVDHWCVTVGLRAETRLAIGDATLVAPARSPFVVSLADEMVSERGPDERLQLYLSRDSFPDLAPLLDAARGAVLTGPHGTMLAEFLELLDRNLPLIDGASAAPLKHAVGAMIVACLSPSSDRIAAASSQLELGRLEKVRRIVRQELRSPKIGPAALCRHIGMSRSALYRLMEGQGGVMGYIRRQRLLESRAMLGDPGCDRSIAAIAEEFCFSDAADFSRAFRREFGLTPSDVRAAAKAGLASPASTKQRGAGGDATFNDFIQAL